MKITLTDHTRPGQKRYEAIFSKSKEAPITAWGRTKASAIGNLILQHPKKFPLTKVRKGK